MRLYPTFISLKECVVNIVSISGGETWLAFQTLAILVKAWDKGTFDYTSNMYPVYDIRHSTVNDNLFGISTSSFFSFLFIISIVREFDAYVTLSRFH